MKRRPYRLYAEQEGVRVDLTLLEQVRLARPGYLARQEGTGPARLVSPARLPGDAHGDDLTIPEFARSA